MEKKVSLVHKQKALAVTFLNFRDYKDNSEFALRVRKDSPAHNEWSALEEGKEYVLSISEANPVEDVNIN